MNLEFPFKDLLCIWPSPSNNPIIISFKGYSIDKLDLSNFDNLFFWLQKLYNFACLLNLYKLSDLNNN